MDIYNNPYTKKNIAPVLSIVLIIILVLVNQSSNTQYMKTSYIIKNTDNVQELFVTNTTALQTLVKNMKAYAQKAVNDIIAIPAQERTFENTVYAYDYLLKVIWGVPMRTIYTLSMVSPDNTLRQAAFQAKNELSAFAIDLFSQNEGIYNAFKEYAAKKELASLREDQQYYFNEAMRDFEREGLNLPKAERDKLKQLFKKINELASQFQQNINAENRTLAVSKEELAGMDDLFLSQLKKDEAGLYILTTDYPVYHPIMGHCSVASTREKLYKLFVNRAFPANEPLLKEIIALRDQCAKILGFESFAAYQISDQMAETTQKVKNFLDTLIKPALKKAQEEVDNLKKDIPHSVSLDGGKFLPWDIGFSRNYIKKKYHDFDDLAIAQYFPLQNTIAELLHLYETFLGVAFEQSTIKVWDTVLPCLKVFKKSNDSQGIQTLLGFLILDLHPRPNKYTHACHMTVVSALQDANNVIIPGVGVVIANFPAASSTCPALLKLSDVNTFFHEFGHALHGLLGATQMPGFSGTSVKLDFVEMPSQMLEEWLYQPEVLKKISHHYKTGEPLSQELIDTIISMKNFSTGDWLMRQLTYSYMSLLYYEPGAQKDLQNIMQSLQAQFTPYLTKDDENHFYTSFGHITGYGAGYYGYLWSKVFALDLFAHIKEQGLDNPSIGQKYVDTILAPGGSKDPNVLLKEFLGREPNNKAFFVDLGIGGA